MQTRVYVPLSAASVRALSRTGGLAADRSAPLAAYAVTPALRQAHVGWDEEDLEYLAFADAARSGTASAGSPRLVVAADVEEGELVDDVMGGSGSASSGDVVSSVLLTTPVPVRRIVSLHVEDLTGARPGPDELADFLWYDVTELESVTDLLA